MTLYDCLKNIVSSKIVLEEGSKWSFVISIDETKILMKSSKNNEENTYYLAHEYGHYLSNQSNYWTKYQLIPRLQRQVKFVENTGTLSCQDMYYLLLEEFRAWRLGYKVLGNLPYSFSKLSFWITAAVAMSTYIRGYLRI